MYDFLLYLIPQTSQFPRSHRYLLGERVEGMGFDTLELLLDAVYSRDKLPLLRQANLKLEKARYYVRLCKDLKLVNLHRYEVSRSQAEAWERIVLEALPHFEYLL